MRKSHAFLAVLFGLVPFVVSAQAQPWNWSDISNKLNARTNRPVWAMARAGSVWFTTDGQDLSARGHVWRTDGTNVKDITSDVRGAGIGRVDDIVSDGSTVLFLKDVALPGNVFEAVSFDGSKYVNRTEQLRAWFDADEGLAQVSGSHLGWAFVTTKNRVRISGPIDRLKMRPEAKSGDEMAVPVDEVPEYAYTARYASHHVSPDERSGFFPAAAVPFENSWFIAQRKADGKTGFLVWNRTTGMEDVTSRSGGIVELRFIASNGATVLVAGSTVAHGATDRVLLIGAESTTDLTEQAATVLPFDWSHAIAGWNGTSWMILSGKQLVRFDGSAFVSYGKTRDYFLNIDGAPNGTFLLGGVVSDASHNDVPEKLVAKLVRVTERVISPPLRTE